MLLMGNNLLLPLYLGVKPQGLFYGQVPLGETKNVVVNRWWKYTLLLVKMMAWVVVAPHVAAGASEAPLAS